MGVTYKIDVTLNYTEDFSADLNNRYFLGYAKLFSQFIMYLSALVYFSPKLRNGSLQKKMNYCHRLVRYFNQHFRTQIGIHIG